MLVVAGIPEGHAAAEEAASKMKDWQSEFAELDKGSQELTQDCDHFGLPAPVFPALDHLREERSLRVPASRGHLGGVRKAALDQNRELSVPRLA